MANQFTNRPEVFSAEPDKWKYVEGSPSTTPGKVDFAKGATEVTGTGAVPGQPDTEVPPDPRLGTNPQGEWDAGKMKNMFPEMFLDTSQWLDPAEQAKKDAGLVYDENKRYNADEYRAKESAVGTGIGGQPLPQQLPQWQALDRNKFESFAFGEIQKATGIRNPYTYNPYDAVLKADAELPDLFNHVFQGIATWKDLPNLSKEQRAYWEEIKKQHHARVFDEAKGKKQQAMQMYGWMMQKFDMENRAELANTAREQKRIASEEARSGKAGTFRSLLDEDTGQMTLHELMPDGHWRNTGKRTGLASLEDRMPPEVKAAHTLIKESMGKVDSGQAIIMMMLEKSNPELAKTMMETMIPQMTPELKLQLASAQKVYTDWLSKMFKGAQNPKASTAAAAPKANPTRDLSLVVQAAKDKNPNTAAAIGAFKQSYPNMVTKLDEALKKIGYTTGVSGSF